MCNAWKWANWKSKYLNKSKDDKISDTTSPSAFIFISFREKIVLQLNMCMQTHRVEVVVCHCLCVHRWTDEGIAWIEIVILFEFQLNYIWDNLLTHYIRTRLLHAMLTYFLVRFQRVNGSRTNFEEYWINSTAENSIFSLWFTRKFNNFETILTIKGQKKSAKSTKIFSFRLINRHFYVKSDDLLSAFGVIFLWEVSIMRMFMKRKRVNIKSIRKMLNNSDSNEVTQAINCDPRRSIILLYV